MLTLMMDFVKIPGSGGFDRQAQFVSRVCTVSDNFRKVENARFRVAFVYHPSLVDTAEAKWIGRFFV